ncbi:MAG: Uma2 family endonuclease [Herpetosiphonaceae bacterium]|nr:Uma2 family endonuclease [Herpetosiphonaceae bacterium]
MATATKLITAEEMALLPEDEQREIYNGQLVEMSPVGWPHGAVVANLLVAIAPWAKAGPGGYVGTETGCLVARNPDILFAPDVLYISAARIQAVGQPRSYWEGAPDLAVEVVSPGDSAMAVREKIRQYLQAGARLVWVVYPPSREVIAYLPDGTATQYGEHSTLTNSEVLPGFACAVADLFA